VKILPILLVFTPLALKKSWIFLSLLIKNLPVLKDAKDAVSKEFNKAQSDIGLIEA